MNKPFKFKEFTVQQDKCAMKIGTDGVLLGAWTSITNCPDSILDIGTGTGLIALQLAQRSSAGIIDALEIDADAHKQAVENFENSPWADRLFCYHTSLRDFSEEINEKYDLILSNPPFHTDQCASKNSPRNKARFTSSLSFEDLFLSVSNLLSEKGNFSVIIPYWEEKKIIHLASKLGLHPIRICRVKGSPEAKIKRSLLAFSFDKANIEIKELVIETGRHQYTKAYQNLVKNFYLKM